MTISTSNFGELLEPGLRVIYGDAYKQYPQEYTKVFEVRGSTKGTEHALGITGFGLLSTKAQGASVTYDDPLQGYKHSVSHTVYGKGYRVTQEMYEDDQYDKITGMTKALARSVAHTQETNAANILNRAFNSSYTGSDSLEMCSAVHTLIGGGTSRNELSTSADLTMTSLEQALIDIQDFVDDRGLICAARPVRLIIPTELEWTAKQLLGSEKDPESAMNAINPGKGIMPYVVMHFLTDSDAWFIQTDMPNGLIHYDRRKPVYTRDNDHDTDNAKFKVTYRAVDTWDDWRGIFGSPGA